MLVGGCMGGLGGGGTAFYTSSERDSTTPHTRGPSQVTGTRLLDTQQAVYKKVQVQGVGKGVLHPCLLLD